MFVNLMKNVTQADGIARSERQRMRAFIMDALVDRSSQHRGPGPSRAGHAPIQERGRRYEKTTVKVA